MYEQHFGLTDKPFRLTPDARFFFPSDQHWRALAFLEYGLLEGEGFIVITGEPGTGKSTLVSKLMAQHSGDPLRVAAIETSRLSDEHLLEMLVSRFELKPSRLSGKTGSLEALRRAFLAWDKRGIRALIIVDEAQNLPSETLEELRMLSNLTNDGQRPLVQTFLVGQPALRSRIEGSEFEQLRQRITASFHLGPFKLDEVQPYIEYRLQQAGWQGEPVFNAEAYEAIYQQTAGVPRLINMLCDRLLLFCYLEAQTVVDAASVRTVATETGVSAPRISPALAGKTRRSAAPDNVTPSDGEHPLTSVSELIGQLRRIEHRIQMTERRLHLDITGLKKLVMNGGPSKPEE